MSGTKHEACVHCKLNVGNRPRGLCSRCYYRKKEVRNLYPVKAINYYVEYGSRRAPVPDFNGRTPLPVGPTDATPGSLDKLRVLEERASNGLQLHHPLDRKLPKKCPTLQTGTMHGTKPWQRGPLVEGVLTRLYQSVVFGGGAV